MEDICVDVFNISNFSGELFSFLAMKKMVHRYHRYTAKMKISQLKLQKLQNFTAKNVQ